MKSNKFGIYYNKQFNCLMLSFSDEAYTNIYKKEDIVILKNQDKLVGINLLNVGINIENGLVSNDERVLKYVREKLNSVIELEQQPHFYVGKIIECNPIPETHLSACKVDLKSEILKVVCGAPNAKEGIYVIVATDGSWMPNGIQILKGQLRGYDSEGMLCSSKELDLPVGLFNDSGIVELPAKYHSQVGNEFKVK